jgi:TetR/AcrR family transcriptional regulator, transcriptional repressor for nem operon
VPRHKEFDTDAAVENAMQQFWSDGYAGTTPQRLVDALGIGRGSLYNAFGSKHELYERALTRYRDRESQRVIDALDGPGPAIDRLRDAVRVVAGSASAGGGRRGCLMTNAATELGEDDETVANLVRSTFQRQRDAFRLTLRQGQAEGTVDKARDADEMAAYLLTLLNGVQVLARVVPSAGSVDALVDNALRAIAA